MKITWKTLLALFFYTLGVVGWFYVGGWMILRGPVRGVILAHMAGDLSLIKWRSHWCRGLCISHWREASGVSAIC